MGGVPSTTGQIHASGLRPTMPAPTPKRWVIRRKAEVVAAVRDGLLTLEEACSRYMLTVEEFLSWQYSIDQCGLAGLRTRQIPANNSGHNRRAGTRRRKRRQPADLLPQLPPGAPKAKDAADGAAVITDLIIIRPALAVEKNGAAEGEGHGFPKAGPAWAVPTGIV